MELTMSLNVGQMGSKSRKIKMVKSFKKACENARGEITHQILITRQQIVYIKAFMCLLKVGTRAEGNIMYTLRKGSVKLFLSVHRIDTLQ